MRYRKKATEIEAIQWIGGNTTAVTDWILQNGGECGLNKHISLYTPDGIMTVYPGDWVVKDRTGFYPCRPHIFVECYEKVEE